MVLAEKEVIVFGRKRPGTAVIVSLPVFPMPPLTVPPIAVPALALPGLRVAVIMGAVRVTVAMTVRMRVIVIVIVIGGMVHGSCSRLY